jgi:hypothetical protein
MRLARCLRVATTIRGIGETKSLGAILCPMDAEEQPHGLAFDKAYPAGELQEGQIIVLDGHVLEVKPDPDDPELVRITLARALGPPPGRAPDQRRIELVCPRDMAFGTAVPHNIELAPLTTGV